MTREVPATITVMAVLVVVFSRYFSVGAALDLTRVTDRWLMLTYAASVLVGVLNLSRLHLDRLRRGKDTWFYDLVLLGVMYGYIALGLIETNAGTTFRWVYNAVLVPLDSTMYSLLAFYIASASFRAFRVRSFEAALMMIAAALVMLGSVPLGDALSPFFPAARGWLMRIAQTAGFRGIQIGAGLGGLATAFRIFLGIERAHLRA
ncbi:MAG: hypothetical protein ACYC6V_09080 [Bacillota bacterium]